MQSDNRISGTTRAEIQFVNRTLVRTLDKSSMLRHLKDLRRESVDPVEADLLGELIADVDSGDFDG